MGHRGPVGSPSTLQASVARAKWPPPLVMERGSALRLDVLLARSWSMQPGLACRFVAFGEIASGNFAPGAKAAQPFPDVRGQGRSSLHNWPFGTAVAAGCAILFLAPLCVNAAADRVMATITAAVMRKLGETRSYRPQI